MEKGVKQGKGSYLILSMKKDQANKTNVEGVYRWRPLAWEPGPDGSGVNLQLVQEWVQCSHMSCASMHQSWSGAEVEEVEWRWRRWRQSEVKWSGGSGGGGSQRWLEVGGEGEGRLYHDITPLLCHYVSEQHGFSMTLEAAQGGQSGSRGGVWGIRGLEVEFLYSGWGMDLRWREPHVI